MIITKYRSSGKPLCRFVRKAKSQKYYEWCEQSIDNPRFDVAQGTCDAEDLPDDIRIKCDNHNGSFYACEWKL